ncbi:MAG: hydrogenase small subunit [Candidatus Omnitrophica bacterium]|nr:hydrogenase small subunit [Candidatus Omnitrophota bacterium]
MRLTRREFLKLCSASAIGMGISQLFIPEVVEALEEAARGKPPVIWIQGAGDSGCSVSLLNTCHPSIAEVLLKIISLHYHPTLMASAGDLAVLYLDVISKKAKRNFFLVVEGAIPTGAEGRFCTIGARNGRHITLLEAVRDLGAKSKAVIALGTCATHGGIPSAKPNPTEARSVKEVIEGIPIINIPGCPSHPDWFVGTLVHVLLFGIPDLDNELRPKIFFSDTVHQNCSNYSYFNNGEFAKKFGDKGCLIQLGCKGAITNSDCPLRRWNSRVSWCVESGAPCIGCCSPGFPDLVSPLYTAIPEKLWPERESALV